MNLLSKLTAKVVIKVGVQLLFRLGGGGWVWWPDKTKLMLISTQVEVVDEHMILLFKNRLSQLSLGQSHYLSGWVGGG